MLETPTFRICPNCGSDQSSRWEKYSPDGWDVVCCVDCDLTYLRNPVSYDALEDDFAWEKTYAEKASKGGSTVLSPVIRKLREALGIRHRSKSEEFREWFHDGHVLDIGCGAGGRIGPPMTPYGIELSTGLHAKADKVMRAHGGYCIHGAGADAIMEFDEAQFDGILMHSYLEHETNVMGVLGGAFRTLKPGGSIYVRVPNFASLNRRLIGARWCGFRYPDHVNYFTAATLRKTVSRAGFSLELVNGKRLMFDDNIQALLHKPRAA